MDKVLIVDGDLDFLKTLKKGLDKLRQFQVETAADGAEAIALMAHQPISVLVADIETRGLDSLDLLAHMTQKHGNTPCILMTDQGKPWFRQRLAQQSFLYHLEKPFEISKLASAIFIALNLRDEGENIQGMTMQSLLPLVEIQQRTCRMKVTAKKGENGYLYFKRGTLFDAHYKDLNGEAAAREIAAWQRISVHFSELPPHRTRMRVKTNLMDIADATWIRPEPESQEDGNAGMEPVPEAGYKSILDQLLSDIKHIKGLQAALLMDLKGNCLASEIFDPATDPMNIAPQLYQIFSGAQQTAAAAQLAPVTMLNLHVQNHVILIRPIASANETAFCLIVISTPRSNWYYIKIRLDELNAKFQLQN